MFFNNGRLPLPPGERKNKVIVLFVSPEPSAYSLVSLITNHQLLITHYDLGLVNYHGLTPVAYLKAKLRLPFAFRTLTEVL